MDFTWPEREEIERGIRECGNGISDSEMKDAVDKVTEDCSMDSLLK